MRVFELFQFSLYSEKLLDAGESIADVGASLLVRLYLFAEARCIPQLQNATIDALFAKKEVAEEVPIAEIPRIYDNTLETSPLRSLIVDVTARTGLLRDSSSFGGTNYIRYNKTFLIDLALALYDENLRPGPHNFVELRCNYHIHAEAAGCCVSKE